MAFAPACFRTLRSNGSFQCLSQGHGSLAGFVAKEEKMVPSKLFARREVSKSSYICARNLRKIPLMALSKQ